MRERVYAARSKASLFPLAVIGCVFLIPTYRACHDGEFHSPAHFASDNVMSALTIAPTFLFAALLAVLTARALLHRGVDRATRRVGLAALAAFAGVSLV